ncbi:uncharacterized protein PGTG_07367 [Puccinia graminis f. sp. tritici CRL 75-36-700-3]|uniref:Uncharacterized protein n=1 Tax=Puccinia graminis f. sp. tritici (strain CRL 75-36-700-3 / race SCCL) TaxID=418459 RepID=E3K9L9_PUCGT|nr:uncharacterized protein PGTG_07367 [Puccinia graminis f. sp. tritici CRL 75-36-700-3]EFP81115.1 hypothetical protein PGTG_07367 [Puccinia graminis f. sp. tritici CRL 75-36-700-3]
MAKINPKCGGDAAAACWPTTVANTPKSTPVTIQPDLPSITDLTCDSLPPLSPYPPTPTHQALQRLLPVLRVHSQIPVPSLESVHSQIPVPVTRECTLSNTGTVTRECTLSNTGTVTRECTLLKTGTGCWRTRTLKDRNGH